eukprot:TRINITY_DN8521_c0_g1_i2.p1 TRINITY_DN8521_c0_g1~~TRINITY_DN8521_c0_g1_i2.p1  ORF type:complete len:107 (-),score=21.44 TRINITY_DN8521_c0_g1_i2:31-351(-)
MLSMEYKIRASSQLVFLDLSRNQLSGILPVISRSQISVLNLSDNQLIGEISHLPFAKLTDPVSLMLNNNQFNGQILSEIDLGDAGETKTKEEKTEDRPVALEMLER